MRYLKLYFTEGATVRLSNTILAHVTLNMPPFVSSPAYRVRMRDLMDFSRYRHAPASI